MTDRLAFGLVTVVSRMEHQFCGGMGTGCALPRERGDRSEFIRADCFSAKHCVVEPVIDSAARQGTRCERMTQSNPLNSHSPAKFA